MKWLLRPSTLLAIAVVLVLAAAVLIFQSYIGKAQQGPLPVEENEEEIVWLYSATNTSSWTLFVTALRQSTRRLQEEFPGLEARVTDRTYPDRSTTVPEIRLTWPGCPRSLVFRWYKLTSERNLEVWISELLARDKPPLAIIGGNSSDLAADLAKQLRKSSRDVARERHPLFLITTATADAESQMGPALESLYADRTFRFCFTNQQMADAVTRFVWSHKELRPDRDPIYYVQWLDDGYSRDLIVRFNLSLRAYLARLSAQEWAWFTASLGTVGSPMMPTGALPTGRLGTAGVGVSFAIQPSQFSIPSSVGTHDLANRFETEDARALLEDLEKHCEQHRSLLLVTGQSGPSRRFLRSLVRESPDIAQRLVVATGDAIGFNTIYRDRRWNWPIQDLPFPLVFFRHQNPVDVEGGFRPLKGDVLRRAGKPSVTADTPHSQKSELPEGTGTETVELFADITTSLSLAYFHEANPAAHAQELAQRMRKVYYLDGTLSMDSEGLPLFNALGGRSPSTGEHVVYSRPRHREGPQRGEAVIEVWRAGASAKSGQKRIATLVAHCD